MNVIETFILLVVVALIVALAKGLALVLGINSTALAWAMVGGFFLFLFIRGEYARRNEFPVCAQGRCRSGQYQSLPGPLSGNVVVECQCGTRYLMTFDRRLMILKGTVAVPFKRQVGLGRWIDDDDGSERSAPD